MRNESGTPFAERSESVRTFEMWVNLEVFLVFAISGSNMIFLTVRFFFRNIINFEVQGYYQVQYNIGMSAETMSNIDYMESSFWITAYF